MRCVKERQTVRDARYISHHVGIGRYMILFNVIVVDLIRNFGRLKPMNNVLFPSAETLQTRTVCRDGFESLEIGLESLQKGHG